MKRAYTLLYIVAALLMLALSTPPASAQATQDALYVYRNDGKFNFFFFGDIVSMQYSPLDTLGVIHNDYVTQEIQTRDSVYRIPLSAIDSVSFTTPETVIKKDVKVCNNLVNYIIASDQQWYILLDSNTPAELIPQKGDKILMDNPVPDADHWWTASFIPNGFGGRVIYSAKTTDADMYGWLIVTEPTPLTDIYDWLVIKEAAATSSYSSSPRFDGGATKPVGGLDGITLDVPERTIELPTFNHTTFLNHSVISTPDGSPVSISGDLTGSISVGLTPKLTYRGCLLVSPFVGILFDQRTVWDMEKSVTGSISGTLNGRFEVGFTKEPKKIKIGEMEMEIGAGLFAEASMTGFEFSIARNSHTSTTSTVAFNSKDMTIGIGGQVNLNPTIRSSTKVLQDTTEVGSQLPTSLGYATLPSKMSFGIGVYAKAETKLALPLEKTKALPDIIYRYLADYADEHGNVGFKAALGFDLGVKLDIQCPWEALLNGGSTIKEMQKSYKDLRDNGSVNLMGYAKATAELGLGKWKLGDTWETNIPAMPRYFAPNITGLSIRVEPDEKPQKPYIFRFTSPISRKIFALGGSVVGFIVVDKDEQVVAAQGDLGWSGPEMFDMGIKYFQKGTYYNTLKVDPGKGEPVKYTVYPVAFVRDRMFVVDQEKQLQLPAAAFKFKPRTVNLGPNGGYIGSEYVGMYEMEVVPNMENVEVSSTTEWLRNITFLSSENELSFHWDDLPDGKKSRRGVIHLIGKSQRGEVLVEDSIVVIQAGPYMVLEPDKLVFPKEGGTKTVTIKETNLKDLKLQLPASSPEITGKLSGNTVTITMPANTGAKRGNQVRVTGKYIDGTEAVAVFTVEQEGDGVDPGPSDPTDFEIEEIELDKYLFGKCTYDTRPISVGQIFTFSNWESRTIDDYDEYGNWWTPENSNISIVKSESGSGFTISATKNVALQDYGGGTAERYISFDVAELYWERNDEEEEYYIACRGLSNLKAGNIMTYTSHWLTRETFEIESLKDPEYPYAWMRKPLKVGFGSSDITVKDFLYINGDTNNESNRTQCETYNDDYYVDGTKVDTRCFVTLKFKAKK
ncbi:MAG: BACON domain-containing protein [Bacteroidaceae bacterium]|nr:BACON domain-containing protein [Bacteroidaceae bacterium]